jgi:NADH-quinone oxidoreductase subunit G
VAVPPGTLLVEAAKQAGIEIPVFCYHPKLKPVGACRMCLVEIEKMPRLQTACTTPVSEGMVANSVAPAAIAGQNAVIELLLAQHPLDCPICDKGGECPLQDNTFKFGLGVSRMREEKRAKDKAFPLSEKIVLDKERCILCYRCTRFQDEIAGDQSLVALERGGESEIGTLGGESFESPFSGNTIELCPVGALTSRFYRFRSRPWDLQRTASVCSGCSVGCNVSLHARDGAILRLVSRENKAVDDGWLCDHGRFQTLPPVTAPAQVKESEREALRPLHACVRTAGRLERASPDVAIARAAALLREQGAVLAAPTLTNEAVTQLRALHEALPAAQVGFTPGTHTAWPMAGHVANLPKCKKVLLLGLDPWTELPVLALWLRKAVQGGGALVAIGMENGLFRDSAAWLRMPSDEVAGAARELLRTFASAATAVGPQRDSVASAAALLRRDGPAALLMHRDLAADAATLDIARQLATAIGCNAETGLLGAPAPGANARGAQEQAPALVKVAVDRAKARNLLLLGVEPLPAASAARLLVAGWRAVPARDDIEVVLPLAHPYETEGTYTNFEGRLQHLRRGGFAGPDLLADHVLLQRLVKALQVPAGAR